MTVAQSLSEELRLLDGMVARARAEIAAGSIIDLDPLDAKVRDICSRIGQLSADDSRTYRPALVSMMDEFDGLAQLIKSGLESLEGELAGSSKRRKAASAYGKGTGPRKSSGRTNRS